MKIIKGKVPHAKKITVYGPEGIGKSTFAAHFPNPVFIDTEGSTKEMDVARFEKPSSWTMILEQIKYVRDHPEICQTLVIDTIDWAEQMCVEYICAKHQKNGLESFGYGSGYIYVREEFGRFLNTLEEVVEAGINVVLTAHAQMRKFEQPDEMGAYDRWELKLGKKTSSQTAPLVKEWSDALLFVNYKTYSVVVDDKGKKHKAQGGKRVMYTTHHPCWDAKNRYGLPEEADFDFAAIAHIFSGQPAPAQKEPTAAQPDPPQTGGIQMEMSFDQVKDSYKEAQQITPVADPPVQAKPPEQEHVTPPENKAAPLDERIPKELRDLMEEYKVSDWDIQEVVGARGYYPSDTPIWNYDPDFISGVLVAAWPQVHGMIKEMWKNTEIPF